MMKSTPLRTAAPSFIRAPFAVALGELVAAVTAPPRVNAHHLMTLRAAPGQRTGDPPRNEADREGSSEEQQVGGEAHKPTPATLHPPRPRIGWGSGMEADLKYYVLDGVAIVVG